MASPLQLSSPIIVLVILVVSNLNNVQADSESLDDLYTEDLKPEARLNFVTGNLTLESINPYVKIKRVHT